jgi:hypothetical protein
VCKKRKRIVNGIVIVAATKLHASRPQKDFTPPYCATLSEQYSMASFTTLQFLSCLHSPGLHCSCCNVVRFCCDLEACNLVTATIACMYVYACMCVHVCVYVCMCASICIFLFSMYVCVCSYVCMQVYICVSMYVCMFECLT